MQPAISDLRDQDVGQVKTQHLTRAKDPVLDGPYRQLGDAGDLVVAAMLFVSEQDQLAVVGRELLHRAIEATLLFASPAALRNVVATAGDMSDRDASVLGRIRLVMSAGAPVPAELLRAAGDILPGADLHTPYGMTEVLPVADISLTEIEAAGTGDGVCVGYPVPEVEVAIVVGMLSLGLVAVFIVREWQRAR